MWKAALRCHSEYKDCIEGGIRGVGCDVSVACVARIVFLDRLSASSVGRDYHLIVDNIAPDASDASLRGSGAHLYAGGEAAGPVAPGADGDQEEGQRVSMRTFGPFRAAEVEERAPAFARALVACPKVTPAPSTGRSAY